LADFLISDQEENFMVLSSFLKGALFMLVALSLFYVAGSLAPAYAAEKEDEAVRSALLQRTNTFCNAVLPSWLKSKNGMQDPNVRDLVADCYMGQARLSILGVSTNFPLEEVALKEVPAILIKQETGMLLDIFQPLAGRTIRTITSASGN
jgi:hypothetical protein